jgi:DNA/RNA-binding domain of Phe-tRNA-synthetase-like protein
LKGKISEPFAGNNSVFVVLVENIVSNQANESQEAIQSRMMQSQQMSIYQGTEGLKKASKIRDYRSKFY